ncbi:hypothetical protein AB0I28_31850 [Phytomonospora sp. NPDC050363]|uniref:hypothetical protein n=1 Tax=Phytomonospora sp. NPDC050363 TaxID=3155642 RepID=UPI0033C9C7C4
MNEYAQLLHKLSRVRSVDAEEVADAAARLRRDKGKVNALRTALETEADDLAEATSLLSAPVLDLRAPVDPLAGPADLDTELRAGHAALGTAQSARKAAVQAGRLPSLMPKTHHLLRNGVVYGGILAGVFLLQVVVSLSLDAGELSMWLAFLPPVAGVLAGYITIGAVARPRVPTVDKHGKVIEFRVYKSPRLGVALAVVDIVAFILLTLRT